MFKPIFPLTLAVTLLGVSACGFTPFLYKIDVPQGNLIEESEIAQIQPGLTRDQVHRILGTPAVTDTFHPNTDYYIYTFQSGTTDRHYQRRLTVNYADNLVISTDHSPMIISQQ